MFDSSKYLSLEEDALLTQLLSRCEGSRDVLMLTLLRRYGMRASELLLVRSRDLNPSRKSLRVVGLKGSLAREFPLKEDEFRRIAQIAKGLGPDERLFPISYDRLGQIWREYRPCDKPLHSLRHTLAIEIYQRTKDIQLVGQVLGHKSITSTMIYQQYAYTQEQFREVFSH